MSNFHMPVAVQEKRRPAWRCLVPSVVVLALVILVAGAFFLTREDEDEDKESSQSGEQTDVTLFMSYIQSVQFAPVYVAYERGYFREAGINLSFENSTNEPDGVDRLAIDDLQFGIISGEQVVLARAAEKPLVYVMEWYHRFPVGIVVPDDSAIQKPEDLAGKKVSIPGPYGASYVGLRALLGAVGLTEQDLTLEPIGFNAPAWMCERQGDAAVVYVANEPLTISNDCYPVRVIEISSYANLVANGLVTNEKTIREKPELVRGMVQALRRGIADTIADPQAAFDISLKYVTDLPEDQRETQRQVLLNSIELWQSDAIGITSPDAWERTQNALLGTPLLEKPLVDLAAAYTNEFVTD